MRVINCIVESDYSNKKNNGKTFRKGDLVRGELIKSTLRTSNPMFKTNDGYIIPKDNLRPISDEEFNYANAQKDTYAEVVEGDNRKVIDTDLLKKDLFSFTKKKTTASVNGAIIGAVIGLGYSMYAQKSKILFSALGSIAGFLGGSFYNKLINEEEDVK